MLKKYIVFAAVAILALVLAIPVMAQVTEMDYEGVVLDPIGTDSFQILVDGTDEYTVTPPAGYPLEVLEVNDVVMVTGSLEDSTITASSILVSVAVEGIAQNIVDPTFTLFVSDTEEYVVTKPDGFDLTTIGEGDLVMVTGWLQAMDNTIAAVSIDLVAVYVEKTGTVVSVDVGVGEFVFEDSEMVVYTVIPPSGFDLGLLNAGDPVMVYGLLQGDTITASAVWVYVKVVGDVLTIDTGTFQFQIDGGGIVTVTPPGGFDISSLGEGDILLMSGWHYGDMLMATEIRVLFRGDGEGNKGGHFCEDLDESHPVARYIAEHYGPFYQEVMSWFCVGRFGFGEIKNMFKAYMMLEEEGISTWDIMAMKEEIGGWGNVWKALGLKDNNGKKDQLTSIEETGTNQHGKPDKAEKVKNNKPEQAGPPDHANNDKNKDKDKDKDK